MICEKLLLSQMMFPTWKECLLLIMCSLDCILWHKYFLLEEGFIADKRRAEEEVSWERRGHELKSATVSSKWMAFKSTFKTSIKHLMLYILLGMGFSDFVDCSSQNLPDTPPGRILEDIAKILQSTEQLWLSDVGHHCSLLRKKETDEVLLRSHKDSWDGQLHCPLGTINGTS